MQRLIIMLRMIAKRRVLTPPARQKLLPALIAGALGCYLPLTASASEADATPPQGNRQCRAATAEDPRLAALRAADPDDPKIDVSSDTGDLGRDGAASLSGNVTIRTGQRLLKADAAEIDAEQRGVKLQGNVEYLDPLLHVRGSGGSFQSGGTGEFQGAEFELTDRAVRGAAKNAEVREDGTIDLAGVRYTACPPGEADWQLEAGEISINQKQQIGTGRDVRLRFKGIPLLYTPWISFPVGDQRKSGLLFPTIGNSGKTGFEVAVPWYWNIAPNMDATITGRIMTARGIRVDPEFRYLTERSRGILDVEFMPYDNDTGDSRSLIEYAHITRFAPRTQLLIDASHASDSRYFEDFGVGFEGTSVTFLDRLAEFRHETDHWQLRARARDYQVIDRALDDTDQPYSILPQLSALGSWRDLPGGLSAALLAEVTNFQREKGTEGLRMEAEPTLDWRVDYGGAFLQAGAGWNLTQYALQNTAGAPQSPSRSLPFASLDGGFTLERAIGSRGRRMQTLEPRIRYLYVPYRDQDDLPVFDTGLPDLNLVQLFRTNRYVGPDRIGDANQLSLGLTTRFFDLGRGRQYLSATVGQAIYFEDPKVRLPNEPERRRSTSDLIAEVEVAAFKDWNARVGYQWNPDQTRTERSEVFLQYRPRSDKVVNFGYRFRRDLLDQFDVSAAWPINEQWRGFARWVYSTRENKTLDQFVGLEYNACCWAVRVITRRFVSSRTGASDTSIGLQLELKGLSSVGSDGEAFLRDSIRGYSALQPDEKP